ncbi:hydrogenase maturation protease [Roseospirillum parvum]|uniref:Hydrogenase maturation protease n=1 Tax=Roseospirillum parvum TaxID=83401 RepID=A0A1G8FYD9_9PROT|nr:hydrogenase maturation protease [Roseospirillum parvum]SDH87107.1 hydrogenase maturation protease [Roseospirillum parvum]
MRRPDLVLGVGHPDRGDDALGHRLVAHLEGRLPGVEVVAHHGEGLGLIALWEDRQTVVLVDAAQSGAAPGTLHRLDSADGSLLNPLAGRLFATNSHAFGVAQAIHTAAVLKRLPGRLVVLAVEAADLTLGHGLSAPVAAMMPPLAEAVATALGQSLKPAMGGGR